jgi:hypothetical protein
MSRINSLLIRHSQVVRFLSLAMFVGCVILHRNADPVPIG